MTECMQSDVTSQHLSLTKGRIKSNFLLLHVKTRLFVLFIECSGYYFFLHFPYFAENCPSQENVLSSPLDESMILEFPPEIVRILTQYSDKLRTFGLQITADSNRIEVTRVPECFSEKHFAETKSRRPSTLRNLVENLLQEFVSVMVETRGGFGLVPKTIGNVLNSQACRGNLCYQFL